MDDEGNREVDAVASGDGATLSRDEQLTEQHRRVSSHLHKSLISLAEEAAGKRIALDKRVTILSKLVKAHSELVRTERLVAGMDRDGGNLTAGVIVVNGKLSPSEWHEAAIAEITETKARASSSDSGGRALPPLKSDDSEGG